ncbi:hypothetical protein U9M48_011939 [Paspalum notatum var. saurae]|uniref:RING-type domain-containing protein n=1 Tax=Paspalum notatum var. saurae TaxID=547442 RepID=A0AAQ3SY26_PASNO
MLQRARSASAASTDGPGPRPDSSAPLQSGRPPGGAAARDGRLGGEALVRRSAVAPCVTCGICGRLLRDATAFSECLDAFCRKCINDKLAKEDVKCCPKCGIQLGGAALEKLRSMIFPAKRRKVTTMKKRKEMMSSESTLSPVAAAEGSIELPPASSQSKAQNIEVEVIDEANDGLVAQELIYEDSSTLNLAPVGRDALSQIRCRDFHSACSLTAETGALITWQPPLIPEEIVAHYQLASMQDLDTFRPVTSDMHQRQAPTAQMTKTSFMIGSSSRSTKTVQDDENFREDIFALFNESNAKIMRRYGVYISQLKTQNAELVEEMENERAAALERTQNLEKRLQRELENERAAAAERIRILEERHQRGLENEREAAAERTRVLDERLRSASEIAQTTATQNKALEAENAKLHEQLENGKADNQALMLDILEKSEELATLKYFSDMFESEKTDLENQVYHLQKELDSTRKEHARYVRKVLDAARAIPNDLEAYADNKVKWNKSCDLVDSEPLHKDIDVCCAKERNSEKACWCGNPVRPKNILAPKGTSYNVTWQLCIVISQ